MTHNCLHDISKIKYYKIDDAIESNIQESNVFIVANEMVKKSGGVGRYFTIFPTFKNFLKNRHRFPCCHEIFVDHKNNVVDTCGRLVFDFDIKLEKIPNDFKSNIQYTVIAVIENYYLNVDTSKFDFIWSTSKNPAKYSKHLTVKNCAFNDWVYLSKIFYKLFCIEWDKKFTWINSSKLIDFQIVRKKASLRMVGSKKINGYPLIFDNADHHLADSLIRIYSKSQYNTEQILTIDNINPCVLSNVLNIHDNTCNNFNSTTNSVNTHSDIQSKNPVYATVIYNKSFEMYNNIDPGIFKMGKINGKILVLLRIKPFNCLLSNKIHEQENAFLIINNVDNMYHIKFGCYRFCHVQKSVDIGALSDKNLIMYYHPNFQYKLKNKTRKSKKSGDLGDSIKDI